MGSMAFWYEKRDYITDKKPSAVMNFNLWTQCKAGGETFLDIGFLVEDIKEARKLYFYVPFGGGKIEDLSKTVSNSKLISAIFNEKYSVTDSEEMRYFKEVKDSDGKIAFVIYSWDTCSDSAVKLTTCTGPGTVVEIDSDKIVDQIGNISINKNFSDTDKFYFRFRVPVPSSGKEDTIISKYSPPNSFLQSTWSTTYIIDFRFNDLRSLSEEISVKTITQRTAFVHITKLHFLLMTKAHVDVETGAPNSTLRELEENTWDEYVGKKFETKDIVAYHCSEKRKEDEKPILQWEFFAKLKVNNSTLRIISLYLLVLAGITVSLNFISSLMWNMMCNGDYHKIVIIVIIYAFLLFLALKKSPEVVDKHKNKE